MQNEVYSAGTQIWKKLQQKAAARQNPAAEMQTLQQLDRKLLYSFWKTPELAELSLCSLLSHAVWGFCGREPFLWSFAQWKWFLFYGKGAWSLSEDASQLDS